MTDLEMTEWCAKAMGLELAISESAELSLLSGKPYLHRDDASACCIYYPLTDDAQAMAMVKLFDLNIAKNYPEETPAKSPGWSVWSPLDWPDEAINKNLNRAIVECVAKMQKAKETAPTV